MRVNTSEDSGARLVLATLVPALATTLAFVPSFLTFPTELGSWDTLLLGAAPLAALVVNLLLPAAINWPRAYLTGMPQILLFPLLVNVDFWINNRRGYFVGGELDMARGFGTVFGFIFGLLLMALVALSAMLGTWLGGRRQ